MLEPQEQEEPTEQTEKEGEPGEKQNGSFREPLTFQISNTETDLMTAIEIVDQKNKTGSRRMLHLLAVILILYWFIPLLWQDPGQPLNWVMVALALGLGVVVWKGQEYDNRRYVKRFVEAAPTGTVTVDEDMILIQDGRGDSHYYFEQGLAVFGYRNILAIKAAKNRFGMIPVDQLEEAVKESLYARLHQKLGDNFIEREPETANSGIFGKKSK